MIKSLRFIFILLLLSSQLYSFSEIPNKSLIHGTWECKSKNIVMYFSDNNRLEIRIMRDRPSYRNSVVAPKIMIGKYMFIAHSISTRVYDNEKKKHIYNHYRLNTYKSDKLVLQNRKTNVVYVFKRDFTKTSQPKLSIADKIKKLIVNKWIMIEADNTKKFQIIFYQSGQYSIRYFKKNTIIIGRYEAYSNIIRLYQNNVLYNFYIVKSVRQDGISVQDKDSEWYILKR